MAKGRKVRLKAVSEGGKRQGTRPLAFRISRANEETFHSGVDSALADANCSLKDWRRSVRIAIYHSDEEPPATADVVAATPRELIERVAEQALTVLQSEGSSIPEAAVRAVVENLVHADFQGAVVSILDRGARVVVSDSGGGIADPGRALEAGYTTADGDLRKVIRGVGCGLSVAREAVERGGGSLTVGPNLGRGAVVTLLAGRAGGRGVATPRVQPPGEQSVETTAAALPPRRVQVLLLMADGREVGPSEVADHVGLSLTTAYRDLSKLEHDGLVSYTARGKRRISEHGQAVVAHVLESPGG